MKKLKNIVIAACMIAAAVMPLMRTAQAKGFSAVSYNANTEHGASLAVDGDISTYWESSTEQKPGDWISVDLGEAKYVVSASLRTPSDMGKYYPGKMDIYISDDPDNIGVPAVSGISGRSGDNTVYMPGLCYGRYLRFMLSDGTNAEKWRIGEIDIKTAENKTEAEKMLQDIQRISKQETLLSALGIIKSASSDYDRNVTRGEFCSMIVKALNYQYSAGSSGKSSFSDVAYDYEYSGEIEAAKTIGIVSETSIFEPDRSIAYNEALKMTICALRYGGSAEMKGGYPEGYIQTALSLNLTSGVSREMSFKDCIALIYNMLNTELCHEGNIKGTAGIHGGETVLYAYHNITISEGIVNANDKISLTDEYTYGKNNEVIVGESYYNTGGTDISEYVGYNVKVYTTKADGDNDTIVSFELLKNKNSSIQIDSSCIDKDKSTRRDIAYYNERSGKVVKKAKISPYADVIYNFRLLKEYTIDELIPQNGNLRLIDNDGDNQYDVVIISSYAVYTVQQVSATSLTVYDKYGMGSLCFDRPFIESVDYYGVSGNPVSFASIKTGMVIKVKAEYEKKIGTRTAADNDKSSKYEVICCDKSVTGSVTARTDKGYKIDGVYYELSETYSAALNDGAIPAPIVSDSGVFYLDEEMLIVSSELKKKESVSYGYIIKVFIADAEVEPRTQIKLLTETGEIRTMECAEKVTVDGLNTIEVTDESGVKKTEKIDAENLAEFLREYRSIIAYTTDYDGCIRKIDTSSVSPQESPDTSLTVGSLIKNADFNYWRSMILSKKTDTVPSTNLLINNGIKLMVVPGDSWVDSAYDEDYFVTGKDYLVHDQQYTCRAVNMSEVNVPEMLIVYCTNGSTGSNVVGRNSPYVMVNDIYESLNNEGEAVTAISAYYKGALTEFYMKDNKVLENAQIAAAGDSGLHRGDLLQVEIGGHSTITALKRIIDVTNMKEMGADPEDYYQDWRETFATVYARKGNAISLSVSVPVEEITKDTVLEAYFIPSGGMMYDMTEDKVVPFASDEIKAYKTMGDKDAASRVFIVTSWAEIQCFAVYNY